MLQGMEKEIIVLSVTVNQPGSFLSDQQRLNVAITRAKRHLIIAGDLNSLPNISPAFQLLMTEAAKLSGGICNSLASFIPAPL